MVKHEGAPLGSRTAPVGGSSGGGHPQAPPVAWLAVFMVIAGVTIGAAALITKITLLWIIGGVVLAVGMVLMLTSKVMDQAY